MKITSIRQQVKRSDRYSLYVDGEYAFSLSESALLQHELHSGIELTAEQVQDYKRLSVDDKLYSQALKYVAMRTRTMWEVTSYLQRKEASPPLIETVLNKLSTVGLLDDKKYAESFVNDRRLLKPSSRRKLMMDLRKKRISSEIIEQVVGNEQTDDQAALLHIIETKRRQTKYQDDTKLMQYLARQGFRYDDIKTALRADSFD